MIGENRGRENRRHRRAAASGGEQEGRGTRGDYPAGVPHAVSRSRLVPAPPEVVFDILTDPRMHPVIDGSGTVRSTMSGPERLTLGSRFGMRMHNLMPYALINKVVEYDEGRLIAWRHPGLHRWRYELEPAEDGTLVTETFDYSTSPAPRLLELMRFPAANAKGIAATLERLADVAAQRAGRSP